MKRTLVMIGILVLGYTSYSNEWEVTHYNHKDIPIVIEVPDTNVLYILSSNGSYENQLYKTYDKGRSWILINDFKEVGYKSSYNLSCPDTSNIFVSFEDGILKRSTDGGVNFNDVDLDSVAAYYNVRMYNQNIGILTNVFYKLKSDTPHYLLTTQNGWHTYEILSIDEQKLSFLEPIFANDTLVYTLGAGAGRWYLFKLNIKSSKHEILLIDPLNHLGDLCVINEDVIFTCGKSNTLQGGSGHDAIYKSTDGGESWKRVLDLYTGWSDEKFPGLDSPFGLQSIAFKDENTGIAVGQFGKIVYTYDGGESWIYESNLPDSVAENNPPTMHVRYAGRTPIMATFSGHFFRMVEDTYAPSPDDTLTISGRVWEGDKGQSGIPIAIGYRVTMTDENGYYKFGQLSPGNYTVRALNKYYDDSHPNLQAYYYKPYAYHPEQHEFELTGDTTGIDFDAEDIREYYNLSGAVTDIDGKGIAGIELSMGDSLTTTTSDGSYEFIRLEKKQYNVSPLNEGYTYIPETYVIGLVSDTSEIHFQAIPDTSNFIETSDPDTFGLHIENGILHFDELPGAAQMQLTISDLAGRELLNEPMKQEHDISFLSPGVYIISLRKQGEIVRSYKVVVE